jgi:hypothetical protein
MKKELAIFALYTAFFIGCSKQDAPPPQTTSDSLLSRPLDPAANPITLPGQDSFKQYIDPNRVRTPEHLATMKRFTPNEVVIVYHDFKPLRKKGLTAQSPEVTKFLTDHSITLVELKAILEEGDRLGWSKVE